MTRHCLTDVWRKGEKVSGVDEPRRPRHQYCRKASRCSAHRPMRRFAIIARREAQVLRDPVPSRSRCTRRTALRCCAISCARLPARTGDWTMRAFKDEAIEKIRKQVGKGRVICGLSGGVDSAVRRGADPRSDRRAAHLRVRRSRTDAARRGAESRHHVPRQLQHPAGACERFRTLSSRRLTGVERSGGQAQDHRQAVHRRVRSRGEEDRRRRISLPRARSIRT